MKTLLSLIFLLTGLTAQAQTTDEKVSEFSSITMFINSIESVAESTRDALGENEALAEEYDALGFLQLIEKNRVARTNCGFLRAHSFSSGITISTVIEMTKDSLKSFFESTNEVNQQEAIQKLSLITSYMKKIKKASEECHSPSKSLKSTESAFNDINEASSYLKTVIQPIVDKHVYK